MAQVIATTERIAALLDHLKCGLDEAAAYAADWDHLDAESKGDFTAGWSLVTDRLAQLASFAASGVLDLDQQKQYAALREKEQRLRPAVDAMLAGAAG